MTSDLKKCQEEIEKLREQVDLFQRVFDSYHNGAVITDAEGYVTHINKAYSQFLGIDSADCIGRHCTEVVENTRMHIVAKTGKAELNHTQNIRGQSIVVHRIPIKKYNKVIAVFGLVMFQDVKDIGKLAQKFSVLQSKVKIYEQELLTLRSTRYTFDSIISVSEVMKRLKKDALRATSNTYPVLISGQSGTGKELFAQAIHQGSARKYHAFVRINCAAIPKDLLESELFGYERGAFTGAKSQGKPGKFELAHHGTIFLDEIGDLPLEMQPKLLRVLEEREFERVGGNQVIHSDFRLIAATNQDLEQLMEAGRFRRDLFYRLNVIPLHIPPLADRREDIIPLCYHFLNNLAQDMVYSQIHIDDNAQKALMDHNWPGNVRELSNVLERALAYLEGDTIHLCDLPYYLIKHTCKEKVSKTNKMRHVQQQAETEAIRSALRQARGNKSEAARILGIHRTLLYKKMKKYGI